MVLQYITTFLQVARQKSCVCKFSLHSYFNCLLMQVFCLHSHAYLVPYQAQIITRIICTSSSIAAVLVSVVATSLLWTVITRRLLLVAPARRLPPFISHVTMTTTIISLLIPASIVSVHNQAINTSPVSIYIIVINIGGILSTKMDVSASWLCVIML